MIFRSVAEKDCSRSLLMRKTTVKNTSSLSIDLFDLSVNNTANHRTLHRG